LESKASWAQVIVCPLLNNNKVFNNGIENMFNGVIPIGGHWSPDSILGNSAASK